LGILLVFRGSIEKVENKGSFAKEHWTWK